MNYEAFAVWSEVASAIAFVAALAWVWMKFIQPAVAVAQQNANARIAEAERHRDDAKARLEALQGSIDDAQRDAQAIAERAARQAQAEYDAAIAEAKEAGERELAGAKGELARARAAARVRYRDELLEKALSMARRDAAERVDENVNRKLVQGFLQTLERGGSN
ncbi:MAG TPA: hypothetical protein VFA29_04660 [Candidatus Baltobacteraceae bacterium]|nr:hypothetical protein [Candidatus Baltobacteraceae bacterium]